ncbi:MAG: Ku protein [Proteobacteria bacterium]|nr:Ku protein [Pseudomonadota bacterium]
MAKSRSRAARPAWEGHLRLSLVTCPVALFTATERSADVHFHLINPRTNHRIRMQTVDAETGKPVERAGLVRGFEVSKNRYILLDKEELDAVKLESTRIIDIKEFVDASAIDRIYWDEPYYLAPAGKTGIEAFSVIQAAMKKQDKVALGSLVLHQRERPCALEPRDDGILLTTLRTHDEIRSSAGFFTKSLPKPDKGMLDIAEKIIDQQEGKFDPSHFKDRYEDALRELIERKKKGKPIEAEEPSEKGDNVIDLMAALRNSLKEGGGRRPRAKRAKAARKRAA